jgi:hypothetical protein
MCSLSGDGPTPKDRDAAAPGHRPDAPASCDQWFVTLRFTTSVVFPSVMSELSLATSW